VPFVDGEGATEKGETRGIFCKRDKKKSLKLHAPMKERGNDVGSLPRDGKEGEKEEPVFATFITQRSPAKGRGAEL